MRRFLLAGAFALLTTSVATAEDPKKPPTAEDIKKQLADTETLIAKKKAELAKAQAVLKAANDEYKQIKELGADRLQEADTIAKRMIEKPKQKAAEAWQAAEKTTADAKTAARVAKGVSQKLKGATDPKEIEQLKREVAEAEAAAKESIAEARKAQDAANDASKALETAQKEAFLQRKAVADLQNRAEVDAAKNVVSARKDVAQTQDELEKAEVTLRRLKEQLKTPEK